MIQVDLKNVRSFIPLPYEAALAPRLRIAHDHLQKGDGAGGDFTGWVRLPEDYDRAELWGTRFCEQYPDLLSPYKLRLKLYFETGRKDKFFEVLDQLLASSVVVDNQTLELIRMIQR